MRPVTGQNGFYVVLMENLNNLPLPTTIPISTPSPGHIEELVSDMPALPNLATDQQPTKKWEVTTLRPRHREIMRRILEGANYVQISEAMGMHVQSIMLICTSPMFREELTKLEGEADFKVLKRAEELSNEALDTIRNLMRHARSESIRKASADSILDRAGYSKIEKKIVGVVGGEAVIRELGRLRRERVISEQS